MWATHIAIAGSTEAEYSIKFIECLRITVVPRCFSQCDICKVQTYIPSFSKANQSGLTAFPVKSEFQTSSNEEASLHVLTAVDLNKLQRASAFNTLAQSPPPAHVIVDFTHSLIHFLSH